MEGRYFKKASGQDCSFSKFAEIYLENWKVERPGTYEKNLSIINQLMTFFGEYSLYEIDRELAKTYRNIRLKSSKKSPVRGKAAENPDIAARYKSAEWESKKLSIATVNKEIAKLKAMLNYAVEEEYLEANPISTLKPLKGERKIERFLSKDEISRFISNATGYILDIFKFNLYTGRRIGEILNLKWEDINWDSGTMNVFNQKLKKMNYITMSESIKTLLLSRKDKFPSEYIFCNDEGERVKSIRKSFTAVLKKANIEKFRIHDMRHTAISHMVMSGMPAFTVARIVGHASVRMIDERYGHLAPDYLKSEMNNYGNKVTTFFTKNTENE